MNRFARFVLPVCLVLCGFALQGESPTLEKARQRWERLTPDDQARFRDRYERYRALSEEERLVLAERAARLHEAKERLRAEMSDELRAKLAGLDPRRRDAVLNELVQNELRERGARIREKMPAALLERLENTEPAARARFLSDYQQRARERATREAIDKLGAKLGLEARDVAALKDLPGPQRSAKVLELAQKLSLQDVAEFGLPPGLSENEWKAWRALPPGEFVERVQRHRHEHGWRGSSRGPDDERGEPREGPPPMSHALLEALRPRTEDVLSFGNLPAAERRQRLFELRRARVLALLCERGAVDDARLQELSRSTEPELYKALQELFPRRASRKGERRGPGGPPPGDDSRGHEPGEGGQQPRDHEHGERGKPPHDHEPGERGQPPPGHDAADCEPPPRERAKEPLRTSGAPRG